MADIHALVRQVAAQNGLDPNLFSALVQQESGFNPQAVSPAGAQGLTQLMPATAKSLGVTDPFDPMQNLQAGARYLSQQLKRFGTVPLALAAYNAGPGAVARYGGIPPFSETQNYVKTITGNLGAQPQTQPLAQPSVTFGDLWRSPTSSTPMPLTRRDWALGALGKIASGEKFDAVSNLVDLSGAINNAYAGRPIPDSPGLVYPKLKGAVPVDAAPIVHEAYKWIGTPYSWGGGGPGGPSLGSGRGSRTVGFDCIAKGVLIETLRGPVPIENVVVGDRVLTRKGYRKVLASWKVRSDAPVYRVRTADGCEVIGTADHRVWTENRGWIPLSTSSPSDIFSTCPPRKSWNIKGFGTTATRTRLGRAIATTSSGLAGLFTVLCGSIITVPSPGGMRSTIGTATLSTTTSRTSSAFRSPAIVGSHPSLALASTSSAASAGRDSWGFGRLVWSAASAPSRATSDTVGRRAWTWVSSLARDAGRRAGLATSGRRSTARIAARSPLTGAEYAGTADVFDLTVEGEHEFFAGGILVHNCSGFLQYLWSKIRGIRIPRVTYDQWRSGHAVDKEDLTPGDAVFFRMGPRGPEHVGMYIGGGKFIHAPKTGDVVKVSLLSNPYYRRNFVGGRTYGRT